MIVAKRFMVAMVGVAALLAGPAAAQNTTGTNGETFVQAVRSGDNDKALELLRSNTASVINARDGNGETALIAALRRGDDTWAGYLLKLGADPNLPAGDGGDTPLIAAVRSG